MKCMLSRTVVLVVVGLGLTGCTVMTKEEHMDMHQQIHKEMMKEMMPMMMKEMMKKKTMK